jgi:hypothetical protein
MHLKEVVRMVGTVIKPYRFNWKISRTIWKKDFPLFIVNERVKDGELRGKSAPIFECYVYERSCEAHVNKRGRQN